MMMMMMMRHAVVVSRSSVAFGAPLKAQHRDTVAALRQKSVVVLVGEEDNHSLCVVFGGRLRMAPPRLGVGAGAIVVAGREALSGGDAFASEEEEEEEEDKRPTTIQTTTKRKPISSETPLRCSLGAPPPPPRVAKTTT